MKIEIGRIMEDSGGGPVPRIVGFTGSRSGMTIKQRAALAALLGRWRAEGALWFRHGDAIGADAQAHRIARVLGFAIVIHPSVLTNQRAFCRGAARVHRMVDPLDRNQVIVRKSDVLVAAPRGYLEELRSGTWSTIRRAWAAGKPTMIVWPNGTITRRVRQRVGMGTRRAEG